jgi:hypothetical protein
MPCFVFLQSKKTKATKAASKKGLRYTFGVLCRLVFTALRSKANLGGA